MSTKQKKTIVCFGDSNTFGYKPDGSGRFTWKERWPGQLQRILGEEYRIVEEGACGRTTVFREEGNPEICGLDCIEAALSRNRPAELLIVMLGTNDCKAEYRASASAITRGLERIVERARASEDAPSRILLIAPAWLGPEVERTAWGSDFDGESRRRSMALADAYRKLAGQQGCLFLDASRVIRVSDADQVHLDLEAHGALAAAVAELVRG